MPTKKDLVDQLAVTLKLNEATDRMAKSQERVEQSLSSQTAVIDRLAEAMEKLLSKDMNRLNPTKLKDLQAAAAQSGKEVDSMTKSMSQLAVNAKKKMPTALIVAAAALEGFVQGLRNVGAMTKVAIGGLGQLTSSAFNVSAAIVGSVLRSFKSLIAMAAQAGGGTNELAIQIEKVREEFGDLGKSSAHAIMETTKTLKGFNDTGLSVFRVFGFMHERMQLVREVAVAMGSTFGVLKKEFEDNGGALLGFKKGLGVSNEGMKDVADRAIAMGRPVSKIFLDMTKQTLALGEAFDIDQKLIGKDMVKAFKDVKHFGAMTVKEIGQASVYARKLGLELDKIVGTLDAFETFDSAAENAAKLSQSFGVQIDAFKMMEAQSPAEQLDMLRRSFRNAGVDAANFTRQQTKLLAQTTGLDEATVKSAFALSNYGTDLNDVRKKSETAAKKQMTQAEAMEKLANSIERMVKSGGGQQGGFWDQFIKGIMGGIQQSKLFMELIRNIKYALMQTYMAGLQLGRAIANIPEIKDVLGGLGEFFSPAKFKALFGGVSDAVKAYLDPKSPTSFSAMMDKLREVFMNFFSSQKGAVSKIAGGVKKIVLGMAKAFAESLPWIAKKVAEGLTTITDLLTGKKRLGDAGALGAGLGFLDQVFGPIIKNLGEAWQIVKGPLKTLAKTIWDKFYVFITAPETVAKLKKVLPWALGLIFGPSVAGGLIGIITSSFGRNIITGLFDALTGPTASKVLTKIGPKLGGIMESGFAKGLGIASAVAAVSIGIDNVFDKFGAEVKIKCGETEGTIGLAAAGVIDALTLGLLPDDIEKRLAVGAGDLSGKVLEWLKGQFGVGFTDSLGQYIRDEVDLLRVIGQAIKDVFSGDTSKIADSIVAVGQKLLDVIISGIAWMIQAIPSLVVKIAEFASLFIEKFYEVLANMCDKGKDLPIIGPILEGLGTIYRKVGKMFGKMKSLFARIGKLFGEQGIFKTIAQPFIDAYDWIKETFISVVAWFDEWVIGPIGKLFSTCFDILVFPYKTAWSVIKAIWGAASKLFDDVVTAIKDVFSGKRGPLEVIGSAFKDAWKAMTDVFSWDTVSKIFNSVVEAIEGALGKLADIPVFREIIDLAKKVFGINSPSKVFTAMGENIVKGFDKGLEGMKGVAEKRVSVVSDVAAEGAKALTSNPASGALAGTSSVESQMAQLQARTALIADHAARFASDVSSGALAKAAGAVSKMVKIVNDMDDALSDGDLNKFNVTAKLGRVAKSLGLGAKAEYTIRNKDVVINLNLKVTMDAGGIEKVMIMRNNSIIRNRLNWALGSENPATVAQPAGPPIPAAYTDTLSDIAGMSK